MRKRPSKKKFIEAIHQASGIIADVARLLGYARSTIQRWISEDEDLQTAVEHGRAICIQESISALRNAVNHGEDRDRIAAAKYLLATVGKAIEPDLFGDVAKTENPVDLARVLYEAARAMDALDRANAEE